VIFQQQLQQQEGIGTVGLLLSHSLGLYFRRISNPERSSDQCSDTFGEQFVYVRMSSSPLRYKLCFQGVARSFVKTPGRGVPQFPQ